MKKKQNTQAIYQISSDCPPLFDTKLNYFFLYLHLILFKFWGQKSTFSPLAANLSPTDQCFQHEKGVSLESRYEGTKIFTPCPQKIGFWAQKRPNLAQNWHFWPNIGTFGPFEFINNRAPAVLKTNKLPRVGRTLYSICRGRPS